MKLELGQRQGNHAAKGAARSGMLAAPGDPCAGGEEHAWATMLRSRMGSESVIAERLPFELALYA